jgi:glycosyltransferase involved in cell wall biosynthesis
MRTLESMVAADRTGFELLVIVVNNSGSQENEPVISSIKGQLPIRLVDEARVGKSFALNRGLAECGNADIIAVVDDDITVDHGWFLGVRRITERWSGKGFFGGSTFVVWPQVAVPTWTRSPYLRAWAYSVEEVKADRLVKPGHWVSGNCFWFRAGLLPEDYQFPEGWLTEPPLMLDLAERGYGGVLGPDAVAYHHVGEELLDAEVVRRRAVSVGESFAAVRLVPFRSSVKQAVLFRRHPIVARLYCVLNILRWIGAYGLAFTAVTTTRRFEWTLKALERIAAHRAYLRICATCEAYRLKGMILKGGSV